jgi:hypothetical protein
VVALAVPVRVEILSGASVADQVRLRRLLSALPLFSPTESTWERMESWLVAASRAGQHFGVADLLIAALAVEQSARVGGLGFRTDGAAWFFGGVRARVSGLASRVRGPPLPASLTAGQVSWLRVAPRGTRGAAPESCSRVSGFGSRASGFGFSVPGCGFRTTGTRLWARESSSDAGIRDQGPATASPSPCRSKRRPGTRLWGPPSRNRVHAIGLPAPGPRNRVRGLGFGVPGPRHRSRSRGLGSGPGTSSPVRRPDPECTDSKTESLDSKPASRDSRP